jgi:hypothetical protein
MDYSNELWIAFHDEDAQNARLAQHIWEDNGLDVPDTFIPYLMPFLGPFSHFLAFPEQRQLTTGFFISLEHENVYVRSACAVAFAEAVHMHPELISEAIVALEELYIERAKVLAPECVPCFVSLFRLITYLFSLSSGSTSTA